jgi:3'(2'), 5'-bisphosphate nucleotidase
MNQTTELPFDSVLFEELIKLMWEASDAILGVYHSGELDTKIKGDESPVTQADLAAHHVLVKGLSQLTPNIPVVSEEDPSSLQIPESHQRYWLIDPLDGTKEFINRNDEFTCNLALIDSNKTIYGFVGVPVLDLLYHGGDTYGAYRVNQAGLEVRIQCQRQTAATRVIASKSHLNSETAAFIEAIETPVELIQAGSSLKFLRIAEGLADIYPRLAPTCEWDTAAAQAILEGAGGLVNQTDGSPVIYGKSEILNPHFIAVAI